MVLSRLFDLNLEYSIKGNIYDEFKCGVVRLNHDGLTVLSVERMLRKLVEHNHQQCAKSNMGHAQGAALFRLEVWNCQGVKGHH